MSLADWAWLALGAYTIHICEEYFFNWRDWARAVIRLPVTWADFGVVNGAVIVLGLVQAALAEHLPLIALIYSALLIINATFFHVGPFLSTRGRFSPGLISAMLLFYPIAAGTYRQASLQGALDPIVVIGSILGGALLMAMPIAFLKLRDLPYFRQD